MRKYNLFCLIFSTIYIYGYSSEYSNNSVVTIQIKAKEYKNQSLYYDYFQGVNFGKNQINLDSNGIGSANILFKENFFGNLFLGRIKLSFYFDCGCDLFLNVDKGKLSFSGKGAEINNYLLKSQELLNQLTDSVKIIDDFFSSTDKFIRLADHCQNEINILFDKNYKNISPNKELDYLLRNCTLASILLAKEKYLLNFEQKEIDSLNLEFKLGLTENNLLKDTLLINNPTGDFIDYLFLNRERSLRKSVKFTRGDQDGYIVRCFKEIDGATQYSEKIREYVMFNFFNYMLDSGGPCPSLDSIAKKLKEQYPSSENLLILENKYNEIAHLMPNNRSPVLRGVSPEGKEVSLNDFKDKVIFVDIWATWCSPCIAALPHIIELQKNYIYRNDIVFIFLSHDRKDGKWERYLSDHPEFKGIQLRAREEDKVLEKEWKVNGIPRYILIDKKGKILDAFANNLSDVKLKGMIEHALLK